MMFAEPAEQVEMLVDAFNRAGVSAENMDPYQKKYMLMTIQNTLGLKSQAEALKFLNASEFQRANMMAEQAKQEESRARIQEQLNQALIQSLPALEGIAELAKLLASLLTPLFEAINTLARAISAGLTPIIMYLNTQFGDTAKVIFGLLIVAVLSLTSLVISFGIAAPAAAAGAAALGAATTAVVGSMAAAVKIAPELIILLFAMAAALGALGFVFASVAAVVYMIGELIVKLSDSKFTAEQFETIVFSLTASIYALAFGMIFLAAAFGIFAVFMPLIIPALVVFTLASLAIAGSLTVLSSSLDTVAESSKTMADSFDSMLNKVSAVKTLTNAIKELNAAITELPQTSIKFEVKTTSGAGTSEMVGTASSPFTPTEKMIAIEKVVIQFDEAGKTAFSAVVKDIVSEWADSTDFKQKTLRAQGFNIAGGQ